MNIKQIEDAIISAIETDFSEEFNLVVKAKNITKNDFSTPAFVLNRNSLAKIPENDYPDSSEKFFRIEFSAYIVYSRADNETLAEKLSDYMKYIDRNTWELAITEASIPTEAEEVEFGPEQGDLYTWSITFSHDFKA